MTDSFNGYHVWLGIPPSEQPPNHYRLLGIGIFETDLDVIDHAADRQMAHVRTFQAGRHKNLSQQILNELAAARVCLLNADRKQAYDDELRARLNSAPKVAPVPVGKAVPVTPTAVAATPEAVPEAMPAEPEDSYDVEDIDPELLNRHPRSLDEEFVGGEDFTNSPVPSIQLGAPRRRVDRDADMQKWMVYTFAAVAAIVGLMVVYQIVSRRVAPDGWKKLFTTPTTPVEAEEVPGEVKSTAPPPPEPVQALEH